MKKILGIFVCLGLLFVVNCGQKETPVQEKKPAMVEKKAAVDEPSPEEKALIEEVNKLNQEKKYDAALEKVDKALETFASSSRLNWLKFWLLTDLKKYEEALALVDQVIQKMEKPDRSALSAKHYVLAQMKKYDQALATALLMEQVSERKTPWNSITIAEDYLNLKDNPKAIEWLTKAVDLGFISLSYLDEKIFEPLKSDEAFKKLQVKIKDNIGIGKPAKDFTLSLITGKEFKLSAQTGKVILVDFWATWCGPCREEIPNLKTIYAAFKDKGFDIMGISLDSDKEALTKYVQENGLGWNFSFSGKAWGDDTAKLYNVNSIPSMWLVDKKGVLRQFDVRGEELKKIVSTLLSEK